MPASCCRYFVYWGEEAEFWKGIEDFQALADYLSLKKTDTKDTGVGN